MPIYDISIYVRNTKTEVKANETERCRFRRISQVNRIC